MMKKIILMIIVIWCICSCKPSGNQLEKETKNDFSVLNDSLRLKLNEAYQKGKIVGFSVNVLNKDRVFYNEGFGFTDIEKTKSYNELTTQPIGSITKTLISIALLKAQELGKLKLDDPINKYLPFEVVNPYFPEIPIQIEHLAYHTSSIVDLDEVYVRSYVLKNENEKDEVFDYFQPASSQISLVDYLEKALNAKGEWYLANTFLQEEPGTKHVYSNIGAALCAQVIESATGIEYREFTKKHILDPLKMKDSGWEINELDANLQTKLFVDNDRIISDYTLLTYPDGRFITSTHDLGIYLTELIKGYQGSGLLLEEESYQKIFQMKTSLDENQNEKHGLFMEERTTLIKIEDHLIGHNGSDPGVMTAMYFSPENGIGRILFINTDTDEGEGVWPEVQAIWKALLNYSNEIEKTQRAGS